MAGVAHVCKAVAAYPLRPPITPASLSVSLTHDIKQFRDSVLVKTTIFLTVVGFEVIKRLRSNFPCLSLCN